MGRRHPRSPVRDQVLVGGGTRLSHVVRADEFLARLGGKEFVSLMPDTSHGAAIVAAERLRAAVAATGATSPPSLLLTLASVPGKAATSAPPWLVGLADRSMNEANRAGRNAVRGGSR